MKERVTQSQNLKRIVKEILILKYIKTLFWNFGGSIVLLLRDNAK